MSKVGLHTRKATQEEHESVKSLGGERKRYGRGAGGARVIARQREDRGRVGKAGEHTWMVMPEEDEGVMRRELIPRIGCWLNIAGITRGGGAEGARLQCHVEMDVPLLSR